MTEHPVFGPSNQDIGTIHHLGPKATYNHFARSAFIPGDNWRPEWDIYLPLARCARKSVYCLPLWETVHTESGEDRSRPEEPFGWIVLGTNNLLPFSFAHGAIKSTYLFFHHDNNRVLRPMVLKVPIDRSQWENVASAFNLEEKALPIETKPQQGSICFPYPGPDNRDRYYEAPYLLCNTAYMFPPRSNPRDPIQMLKIMAVLYRIPLSSFADPKTQNFISAVFCLFQVDHDQESSPNGNVEETPDTYPCPYAVLEDQGAYRYRLSLRSAYFCAVISIFDNMRLPKKECVETWKDDVTEWFKNAHNSKKTKDEHIANYENFFGKLTVLAQKYLFIGDTPATNHFFKFLLRFLDPENLDPEKGPNRLDPSVYFRHINYAFDQLELFRHVLNSVDYRCSDALSTLIDEIDAQLHEHRDRGISDIDPIFPLLATAFTCCNTKEGNPTIVAIALGQFIQSNSPLRFQAMLFRFLSQNLSIGNQETFTTHSSYPRLLVADWLDQAIQKTTQRTVTAQNVITAVCSTAINNITKRRLPQPPHHQPQPPSLQAQRGNPEHALVFALMRGNPEPTTRSNPRSLT
jgi:hypothetical protein